MMNVFKKKMLKKIFTPIETSQIKQNHR